jgi:hypothetical protein
VNELIPLLAILAAVLYAGLRVALTHEELGWPEMLATFVVTVAAVAVISGGTRRYGTAFGAIGNVAALVVAMSPALVLPTALANKLVRDHESTFRILGLTLLSGILLVWTVPFMFVVIACSFGSECL